MGDVEHVATAPGAITSEIAPNTLVDRTIAFVKDQLPAWRDHPSRPRDEAEEKLNAQLCKFLNVQARLAFPMVHFAHEERQEGRRRVDLSALLSESIEAELYGYSIFDPFLVIEAKRLPTPSTGREREYVTGYEARTGGIQRFKLRHHAGKLNRAAMVGYVQEGKLAAWLTTINAWIADLVGTTTTDGCVWLASEGLTGYQEDEAKGTAVCVSQHRRTGDPPEDVIDLYHLWVLLTVKSIEKVDNGS